MEKNNESADRLIESLNMRISRLHQYQVYYDTSKNNQESLKKMKNRNSKSQILHPSFDNEKAKTLGNVDIYISTDYSPMNPAYKSVNKYKQLGKDKSSRPRSQKMSSISSSNNFRYQHWN